MENAIYYAINNNPVYLKFIKNSINSLRLYNREIKVYTLLSGRVDQFELKYFKDNNIELLHDNFVSDLFLTSLKWRALGYLKNNRFKTLLFADADTIFFTDPEILIARYQQADFYARQEGGTYNESGIKQHFNQELFSQIIKELNLSLIPVFNTGIMIFNHNSYQKIGEKLDLYKKYFDAFIKKKLPFPSENKHVIDEITISLLMGNFENFTYDFLNPEDCPMYMEYKNKQVNQTGFIMHIWNYYYDEFLKSFPKELLPIETIT